MQPALPFDVAFTLTEVWPLTFGSAQIEASLRQLAGTGATTVQFQWQTKTDNSVARDYRFSTLDEFRHAVSFAESLGLRTELKPQIFGENWDWSGVFVPTDPAKWFPSYGAILVKYAALAQELGVDALFLTNEAIKINTNPAFLPYWEDIVADVRAVYSGKVSVNAVLTQEAPGLTYAHLLDYIGLSVYEKLTTANDPTRAEIEAAWSSNADGRDLVGFIRGISDKFGKPVAITEFAVAATDGANREPYLINHVGRIDYAEQTDAYLATLAAFATQAGDWFRGINFWGWYSDTDPVPDLSATNPNLGLFLHGGTAIQDNPSALTEIAQVLGNQGRTLRGVAGDVTQLGSGGIDTCIFSGARSAFIVVNGERHAGVTRSATGDVNVLVGVERLQFTDGKLALDLGGNAGTAVRLLGAVFGAASVNDARLVGAALPYADIMSRKELAALALAVRLGDSPTPEQVVQTLYINLFGVAPAAAELGAYAGLLHSGAMDAASLALLAADHSLNASNIDLVGLSASGVPFA